ncbi:PEP-CTERM sorting domain-containing protein [Luteolibacter soli]|uniref:PEP-CTERM sorting domain-containing protein n=1 Tax=Luteolibacter soli TaxID=3135280 RepID=A0ABU9AYP7_9BACT
MKCIPLIALLLGATAAHSQTLDWGNEVFDNVRDSEGERLTNSFVFELGAFDVGFKPTQGNVEEWVDHWNVFDRASYNESLGYFASSVQMTADGRSNSSWLTPGSGSFEGLEAFIFIRNGDLPVPMTEWLLARASTWIFPLADPNCCPNGLPTQWAVSDIDGDPPVWGAKDGIQGGGVVTNPAADGLQTHTFVPEPTAFLLLALGGLASITRRRRF